MKSDSNGTLLDALIRALEAAAGYNQNDKVAPACVLWPDKHAQWQALIPQLRARRGAVLTLGAYEPTTWTGPAVWLRTVLERQFDGATLPPGVLPVLYLPGFGRADLRDAEDCPPAIQPLVELVHRGCLFHGPGNKDWTVPNFFRDAALGLGLDMADDDKTARAAVRALDVLAQTPLDLLTGKHLDAQDFDDLLVKDLPGQVLRWLDNPKRTKESWTAAQVQAFSDSCKGQLGLDLVAESPFSAAERLAGRGHGWSTVWQRYADAPASYPGLPALLDLAAPKGPATVASAAVWPSQDLQLEGVLRQHLLHLQGEHPAQARAAVQDLAIENKDRCDFIWARLDKAPLAKAVQHLATVATVTAATVPSASASAIAEHHREHGWRADLAMLRALAEVRHDADVQAVHVALRTIYLPWLEDGAHKLQQHLKDAPGLAQVHKAGIVPAAGECVLFADGLRFDIGKVLADILRGNGHTVTESWRWAALPTVTATCKPAVSAIAAGIEGGPGDVDFLPHGMANSKSLSSNEFQARLEAAGVHHLVRSSTGDPAGRGWTEHGDLDKHGHDEGWKLALRVDEQVFELQQRVRALFAAGWSKVKIVTDHGWILCPGGLRKVELHKNLTENKWSRCAILQHDAVASIPIAGWSWSAAVKIGLAPGAGVFWNVREYAHGGWSPQEAVLPVLDVLPAAAAVQVRIVSVTWKQMWCTAVVEGAPTGSKVDVRTKASDAGSSLADNGKKIEQGRARVAVLDDSKLEASAQIVVVAQDGAVLCKLATTVGGEP